MATGIKDKVAVLGMGCSKFGERWDSDADDLMIEAFEECIADAGIEKNEIQAAWLGTAMMPNTLETLTIQPSPRSSRGGRKAFVP